jgi:tetratricopeptide (TPR) repeat protein
LARQDPENAQTRRDLAVSYSCLGNLRLQLGDLKATREYFEKSLNLTEQLARQDPENAQAALELGAGFYKLGQVQRAAKQYPEAEAWFRKAQDQLSRLKAQGKLPPAMEQVLATAKKELSARPR